MVQVKQEFIFREIKTTDILSIYIPLLLVYLFNSANKSFIKVMKNSK